MKQTQKYQLNLIERDDTFSPDPLNQNMEKVEGALTAADSVRQAADNALETRIVSLEGRHIAGGTYHPSVYGPMTVNLGFTPKIVIIIGLSNGYGALIPGSTLTSRHGEIIENGFQIAQGSTSGYLNNTERTYAYVAFN